MSAAEAGRTKPGLKQRARQFLPWVVGLAIVAVVATHVPFAHFKKSLGQGPHVAVALTELGIATLVLATDSFATWVALVALGIRWTFKRVIAVRGATYLLVLVNYAVGQGGFGYYLYRSGISALRSVGSTLFILGTSLATLLCVTFGIWAVAGGGDATHQQMWWTLVVAMIAFAVYLLVIAIRIRFLAGREVLAPLFDAHLRGHALAILGRLPHICVIVFGHWIPMRVWGVPVPFHAAAVFMPAVALAAVLPISPAGLGTTQAAMVYFFSSYAVGATADERSASVLAFGVVHFVYGVLATSLVGFACMLYARRTGLMESVNRES